jgi:hypothetical protein
MLTYIAQTPQIQAPQTPADFTVWGVLGGLVFLIGREAVSIFRQQNSQESTIIRSLMQRQQEREDRMENRHDEVLLEIKEILSKTQVIIAEQKSTINEMSRMQANQTRSYAENLMGIRSELKAQNAVLTELLRRSDRQIGIELVPKATNGKSN